MPAHRLPYVKLWHEQMENEKVRALTDSQYRTWTYCLMAASQQPDRWRFESVEHAAYVTRRPMRDLRALIDARFLDQRDDGLWIHDVDEYQKVYPSDFERERSPKPAPTDPERSANTPRKLDEHSNNTPRRIEEIEIETKIETETEKKIETKKIAAAAGSTRKGGVGGFQSLGSVLKRTQSMDELPEEVRLRLLRPVIELNGKTEPA